MNALSNAGNAILAMLGAVVGLAIVAVLVSNNSNTTGVIQSFFNGYSQILSTAITGGSSQSNSGSSSGG